MALGRSRDHFILPLDAPTPRKNKDPKRDLQAQRESPSGIGQLRETHGAREKQGGVVLTCVSRPSARQPLILLPLFPSLLHPPAPPLSCRP